MLSDDRKDAIIKYGEYMEQEEQKDYDNVKLMR
jgi:hypothetical protein